MPQIYINTNNTNKTDKIFIANLVGTEAAAAEDKIRTTVEKALSKSGDFTTGTIPNPKGYTLRLKVSKYEASGNQASCTITGEILRFPAVTYSKSKFAGKNQTETVTFAGEWKGSATATGHGKYAALECIEAIVESMVPRSFPVMKADMLRR
jgi:hypothetical protein